MLRSFLASFPDLLHFAYILLPDLLLVACGCSMWYRAMQGTAAFDVLDAVEEIDFENPPVLTMSLHGKTVHFKPDDAVQIPLQQFSSIWTVCSALTCTHLLSGLSSYTHSIQDPAALTQVSKCCCLLTSSHSAVQNVFRGHDHVALLEPRTLLNPVATLAQVAISCQAAKVAVFESTAE